MSSLLKNLAPDYNPAEQYAVDQRVLQNDNIYQCISPTTGEFKPDDWVQLYLSDIFKGMGNTGVGGGGKMVEVNVATPTTTPVDTVVPELKKIYSVAMILNNGTTNNGIYSYASAINGFSKINSSGTTGNGITDITDNKFSISWNYNYTWKCVIIGE